MTNPASDNNQFELFKQMAQQMGISGIAYIDCHPTEGFIRLKLKVMPPERQAVLTSNFAQVLAQVIQMFGLQVKAHQSDAGEASERQ